jgi:hypothetical protein
VNHSSNTVIERCFLNKFRRFSNSCFHASLAKKKTIQLHIYLFTSCFMFWSIINYDSTGITQAIYLKNVVSETSFVDSPMCVFIILLGNHSPFNSIRICLHHFHVSEHNKLWFNGNHSSNIFKERRFRNKFRWFSNLCFHDSLMKPKSIQLHIYMFTSFSCFRA